MQIWSPDISSEEHLYKNTDLHGVGLTEISFEELDTAFNQIKEECKENKAINELSAVKNGYAPILLMACRHYRLPVPYHFFFQILEIPINE